MDKKNLHIKAPTKIWRFGGYMKFSRHLWEKLCFASNAVLSDRFAKPSPNS
jgi:hypothetical protein